MTALTLNRQSTDLASSTLSPLARRAAKAAALPALLSALVAALLGYLALAGGVALLALSLLA